jgi:dihydroorotate dehydrogenase
LGLAAGFDKNARAVPLLASLGFGHVEVGSVSGWASDGNPRPRLFRLPQDGGIVVSYGVPNEGAQAVSRRLDGRQSDARLGINLVKTNDAGRPAVEPDVYEDYARSFGLLQGRSDYVALNMSCPNSPGDRDFFDDVARVEPLLARLGKLSPRVPVVLKLKPTRDAGVLREIVAIADGHPFVRGFGINLPAGKPPDLRLSEPRSRLEAMPGAVGGRPVEHLVNDILGTLYGVLGPDSRYGLIAAGGVFTAADAYRKIRLGASLVQLYTGLVYRGPGVVKEILGGLVELLERDGFATAADAVGVDAHG